MVGNIVVWMSRKLNRKGVLLDVIKKIQNWEVLVGITQETSTRPGEPINNAELLYVHSHGSPARGIPARPVIEPAIEADGNRKRITDSMAEACKARLNGKTEVASQNLYDAGQYGEDAARNWFTDPRNGWPPNAPSTILRKLDKLKGKQHQAAMDAFESGASTYTFRGAEYELNTPLVDTGELRKSLTHVVREK